MPFLRAARRTTWPLGSACSGVRLAPGDEWPGAASVHLELNFPWRGGMLNFEVEVITGVLSSVCLPSRKQRAATSIATIFMCRCHFLATKTTFFDEKLPKNQLELQLLCTLAPGACYLGLMCTMWVPQMACHDLCSSYAL